MSRIAIYRVAGGQTPTVGAIAFKALGVTHTIVMVGESVVAHNIPIVGILVFHAFRAKTYIRILRPEKRTSHLLRTVVLKFKSMVERFYIAFYAT